MTEEEKKIFLEVLDIMDEGLGFEHGIITNRFATASKIIKYLEQVKKLNIDDVSNCLHENQVMRQGDGDVYHQCLDCCELLE